MDATDRTLIGRVRDPRDAAAWSEFTTLYRPIILRYGRARHLDSADADDVAQDVLKILVNRLKTFEYDPGKGRFSNWLLTIVDNQIKRHLRSRRTNRANTSFLEARAELDDSRAIWEPIFMKEHIRRCLRLARPEFTARTFEAFELSFLKEEPIGNVCAALKVNRNQVYVARYRVLKRLKELMLEQIGYEG
jgi:RNA polymerase sigma-70 factor (ECF subfamily)